MKPKLVGLDIRALRMAEAHTALRELKPLEVWKREMTAVQRDVALATFGSLDAGYEQMRAALEEVAAGPVPTTILLRWDGGVELRWE